MSGLQALDLYAVDWRPVPREWFSERTFYQGLKTLFLESSWFRDLIQVHQLVRALPTLKYLRLRSIAYGNDVDEDEDDDNDKNNDKNNSHEDRGATSTTTAVREFFMRGLDAAREGDDGEDSNKSSTSASALDHPDASVLQLLKEERVRWHPDKVQQRLGGRVDEALMRDVTAVFQVVDALWADARAKAQAQAK